MKPVSRALLCAALGAVTALPQTVISAKSGTIHHVEGRVYLGAEVVESRFGHFPEIKENAALSTEEGRVEVLLNPGVFLRLAENSAIRMLSNRLADTRVEFSAGSAVVEVNEIARDNSVTVVFKGAAVHLLRKGLYRFDGKPPALRVFDGEAGVTAGDRTVEVKEGRSMSFDGELAVARFDKESTDALDRWSRRRGEYLAMANLSAANSLYRSERRWTSSGWYWNPYFGMFTFVPANGAYASPYGWRFYSPMEVYRAYQPAVVYSPRTSGFGRGGASSPGYSTMPRASGGYSGVVSAAPSSSAPAARAPSSTAAAAPAAPVSSSGGGGGAKGRQ